jgi:large subunit ribosomal protein L10
MGGEVLTAEQVDAIARLPSRDVLYGRLVGMVASPITGLASAMGGLIGGLARQLQQIAEQRNVAEGEREERASRLPGETDLNQEN